MRPAEAIIIVPVPNEEEVADDVVAGETSFLPVDFGSGGFLLGFELGE